MPTLKEIRRRICSVRNIQQIARAMKLISAAKFQKTEARMHAFKAYSDSAQEVILSLARRADRDTHPLLSIRPAPRNTLLLVVTSERGLCGAYNLNVIERAHEFLKKHNLPTSLFLIGKKGLLYFRKKQFEIVSSIPSPDPLTDREVSDVTTRVTSLYTEGRFDEVLVCSTHFRSIAKSEPCLTKILPVEGPEAPGHPVDYLYEPKRSDVLERLIPHCLEVIIKRLLLEANLSEHATRMLAMDNAMKNAADMIDQLTLSFNKARQLAITQELSEIVTANEAMKEVVK